MNLLDGQVMISAATSRTPMAELHRIPIYGAVYIVFPFIRPSFGIECLPDIVEAVKLMKDL